MGWTRCLLSVLALAASSMAMAEGGLAHNAVEVPGSPIEVGFSTDHSAEGLIIKTIHGAKREIRVTADELTSKSIAYALIAAYRHGVDVAVVVDKGQETAPRTLVYAMASAGIPVRIDRKHVIQHERILVVDGRNIQTGSFSYVNGADFQNSENAILVRENPALASIYLKEWKTHWDHSDPVRVD